MQQGSISIVSRRSGTSPIPLAKTMKAMDHLPPSSVIMPKLLHGAG
jgi:hypothetical protein